ncbi:uncharacterized protein LOC112010032 isoform X3 [Quercus suber]|uniref:uncharacterized protein LOC112010032 isoform X3 n=1 Tax=Quercus suber TaxID=58331 RepID=UPI0032DFB907
MRRNLYCLILAVFLGKLTSRQMHRMFYLLGNMKKQLAHAWSSQKKVSVLAFWDPCNVTSSKFLCREDGNPVVHEEVGPSEANLFSGKCIIDPNQTPSKQVKPLTQLQKILKFRLATDADIQCLTAEQTK